MKPAVGTRTYTHPAGEYRTLSQETGADVAKNLHGALKALKVAREKASKLSQRKEFAALVGDLERAQSDVTEAKAMAEWIAKGMRP